MKDESMKISPELWEPLEQEEKDAEKIERPSLTFLQDGWRRLRSNWVAMFSMVVILLITVGAIVIPWFWPYTYKQQNLDLANVPASMETYPLSNGKNVYVTPQYTLIVMDSKGNLEGLAESGRKDMIGKKNYYTVDGVDLCVDYSLYSAATAEYRSLEKKADAAGTDMVETSDADYLVNYFEQRGDAVPEQISLEEAYNILENKMERVVVTAGGEKLTETVRLRNHTYLLGTDGLGRDLFIRIVYGARISLLVGFFAAFINFVVGVFYGAIAGYLGGEVDNIMMRVIDILDSIPMTLYVILIMVVVGPGLVSIILALGLTFWVKMARIVRG